MPKFIDLTGKKFNRWTVLKRVYPNSKNREAMWLCKCDCGNERIIQGSQIRNGSSKSCGCLWKEVMREKSSLPLGIACLRQTINGYKRDAKRKGREYELTEDQFFEITQRNCFYCGAKPSNITKKKYNTGDYIYNGIDRIDSNKGYTLDNVVACCKKCNRAKDTSTVPEFKAWIVEVYRNMLK